ncbi:unnamed protein product [Cylicocyclus nassatus]|uniref:Uncharacterized protein n=1 Tax=Cylicocyclus nassatus TaxID=53992 RepID=A0AA36GVN3_CYLNA|nr:unnamed protein product [Cylicocyclus nassatus]
MARVSRTPTLHEQLCVVKHAFTSIKFQCILIRFRAPFARSIKGRARRLAVRGHEATAVEHDESAGFYASLSLVDLEIIAATVLELFSEDTVRFLYWRVQ